MRGFRPAAVPGWAYKLATADGLVDEVLAQQPQVLRRADQGRQPQAAWRDAGALDAVAARIRWSHANRHLFE
ncbi:hypothetical protein ACIBSW_20115 [Actinoplanes sp. NPDC049668]|uniref:hypothetical protein n=1 Tax=unclassified Actinoplanes TaxID=2626549 RepID=UPI0033A79BE4